ncbi:adhesin [Actinotalea sp.]|uniref:adhesin n=1 Tax=Actinotalea sp. TaxID=1872145 RepID=UPI0035673436
MLTLTDNARSAVHELADGAGLPESGGMRIAPASEEGSVELSLVPEPVAGDEVVEGEGFRVYIEPATAALLADQQLDAVLDDGATGFVLAPQA